jgi:predicted TIM-barrel enzyme
MQSLRPSTVLMPRFPVPRGLPAELAALLPNVAYNPLLLEGLALRSGGAQTAEVAAIFMADPFLDLDGFARALERAGISRVTNLPSIAQYGNSFTATAEALDIGLETEWRRLAELANAGFDVFCCVTSVDAAIQTQNRLKTAGMIVALPAMPSADAAARTEALNEQCGQIRAAVGGDATMLALTGERLPGLNTDLLDGQIRYGG